MISYFIVAHCTFTINFSNKLKSQFQVIFGHDSFPLKMSQFQVNLSQNSTNCLLAEGWWNTCFYQYSFFYKKVPISSCKRLVCRKIFLFFCGTDSFGGLCWLFFRNHWVSNNPFSYACRWVLLNTSSMISYLIFLNRSFLHLDADSTS